MDQGFTDFATLSSQLATDWRMAWVRLLLGPPREGKKPVWAALAIVGSQPDGWELRRWDYEQCTFTTVEMPAAVLAGHLTTGDHILKLDADVVDFSFAESLIQWWRHASRQKYASVELPWPSTSYNLSFTDRVQFGPNDYLSSIDAPSFPAFSSAYSAFFYDERVMTGASQPTLGQITLRIADESARISRVVIGAASLDVWVDGIRVAKTRLELNSATDQGTQIIEEQGKFSFPLPHGLGQDAWVWLKGQDGYIDFRALSGWGGSRSAGVENAVSDDQVENLLALAAQGESTWLEYKAELPGESKDSKRRVFKTVTAFANGEGGTLLFGVDGDDDTGYLVGLDGDSAVLQRRVNDLVRALVTPSPVFTVKAHEVNDKCVIRVDVRENRGVIHALVIDANRPEYYVRRNGSTYHARPEELAALIKPAPSSGPFGLRGVLG